MRVYITYTWLVWVRVTIPFLGSRWPAKRENTQRVMALGILPEFLDFLLSTMGLVTISGNQQACCISFPIHVGNEFPNSPGIPSPFQTSLATYEGSRFLPDKKR